MQNLDIRVRIAFIIGLVALCAVLIYPLNEKINLGLDLRGGMHMVMRVKTDDAVKAEIDLSRDRIRAALAESGISSGSSATQEVGDLLLSDLDAARIDEARSIVREQFPPTLDEITTEGDVGSSLGSVAA